MGACIRARREGEGSWRTGCLSLEVVSLVLGEVWCKGTILQSMARSQIARIVQYSEGALDQRSQLTAIYGVDRSTDDEQSPQRYNLVDSIET